MRTLTLVLAAALVALALGTAGCSSGNSSTGGPYGAGGNMMGGASRPATTGPMMNPGGSSGATNSGGYGY
jgi:hypothetical protein